MKVSFFDTLYTRNGDWCKRLRVNGVMRGTMRSVFNQSPLRPPVRMSTLPILLQRDTRAWQFQVWISFGIAVFLCAVGLAWLPGAQLEQAFMVMGYVFCLSAAFVLAKFVRDNDGVKRRPGSAAVAGSGDTPLWKLVVWGGFAVAMALTGWGDC